MNESSKKYIGIDWGERRIGLALGSSETKIAIPYMVVSSFKKVLEAIQEEEIDEVIVGKPIKMSGESVNLTNGYNKFIKKLEDKVDIPIKKIDERLTTKAAEARIGDKKTKAPKDSVAAMEILQSFFDQIN